MDPTRQEFAVTGDTSLRGRADDGRGDDIIEQLRQANPVDVDAIASSHSPEATRVLEEILSSTAEAEPPVETGCTASLRRRLHRRWTAMAAAVVTAVTAVIVAVTRHQHRPER